MALRLLPEKHCRMVKVATLSGGGKYHAGKMLMHCKA
jgi:hypothetical protein